MCKINQIKTFYLNVNSLPKEIKSNAFAHFCNLYICS